MSSENKDEKSIYKMGLHSEIEVDRFTTVRRVPGGWIYYLHTEGVDGGWTSTGCFVAFSDEFNRPASKNYPM